MAMAKHPNGESASSSSSSSSHFPSPGVRDAKTTLNIAAIRSALINNTLTILNLQNIQICEKGSPVLLKTSRGIGGTQLTVLEDGKIVITNRKFGFVSTTKEEFGTIIIKQEDHIVQVQHDFILCSEGHPTITDIKCPSYTLGFNFFGNFTHTRTDINREIDQKKVKSKFPGYPISFGIDSQDGSLTLWKEGKFIKIHAQVTAFAKLPDNTFISGSADATIKHFDQFGNCLATLTGHTARINDLAVFLDGTFFSASADGTIKHWDLKKESGTFLWRKSYVCLSTFGHSGVVALAVLQNGILVSSCGKNISYWSGFTSIRSLRFVEAVPILEALRTNRSVTHANLCGVHLWDTAVPILTCIIENHPALEYLDLRRTAITSKGLFTLYQASIGRLTLFHESLDEVRTFARSQRRGKVKAVDSTPLKKQASDTSTKAPIAITARNKKVAKDGLLAPVFTPASPAPAKRSTTATSASSSSAYSSAVSLVKIPSAAGEKKADKKDITENNLNGKTAAHTPASASTVPPAKKYRVASVTSSTEFIYPVIVDSSPVYPSLTNPPNSAIIFPNIAVAMRDAPTAERKTRFTLLPDNMVQIDTPDDHSCLFWSAALGLLLPCLEDEAAFNRMYDRLFGIGYLPLDDREAEKVILIEAPAIKEGVRNILRTYDCLRDTLLEYEGNILKSLICMVFRGRVVDTLAAVFPDTVAKNPILVTAQLDNSRIRTWEDYTNAMRKPYAWGGDPEIRAISYLAQINICVSSEDAANITYPFPGSSQTLHLVHVNAKNERAGRKNHYHYGLSRTVYKKLTKVEPHPMASSLDMSLSAAIRSPQIEAEKKQEIKSVTDTDKSLVEKKAGKKGAAESQPVRQITLSTPVHSTVDSTAKASDLSALSSNSLHKFASAEEVHALGSQILKVGRGLEKVKIKIKGLSTIERKINALESVLDGVLKNALREEIGNAEHTRILSEEHLTAYYSMFLILLEGAWRSCESIYSGYAAQADTMTDLGAKALDEASGLKDVMTEAVGLIPGVDKVIKVVSGVIKAKSFHKKKRAIRKIAFFFSGEKEPDKVIRALARRLAIEQAETLAVLSASSPSGVKEKAKQGFRKFKNWVLADENHNLVMAKARADIERLIAAIIRGELVPPADSDKMMQCVLGKREIIRASAKVVPKVIIDLKPEDPSALSSAASRSISAQPEIKGSGTSCSPKDGKELVPDTPSTTELLCMLKEQEARHTARFAALEAKNAALERKNTTYDPSFLAETGRVLGIQQGHLDRAKERQAIHEEQLTKTPQLNNSKCIIL